MNNPASVENNAVSQKPQQSLQARLLVMLGGTLLITLVIIIVSIYVLVGRVERDTLQGRQTVAVRTASLNIKIFIEQQQITLAFIAQTVDVGNRAVSLDDLLTTNPNILALYVLDRQGQPVSQSSGEPLLTPDHTTFAEDEWFEEALEDEQGKEAFYISELELFPDGTPYLIMGRWTEDTMLMGRWLENNHLVVAVVDMRALEAILAGVQVDDGSHIYLAEAEGPLIAHSDPAVIESEITLEGRPELPNVENETVINRLLDVNETLLIENRDYTNFTGQRVRGATKAVSGTDWLLFIETPRAATDGFNLDAAIPLSAFSMLHWGGAIFVTFWLLRTQLFKPLADLRTAQQALGEGNLNVTMSGAQWYEIGDVQDGFNAMVKALRDAQQARDDSEMRYRRLVENVTDVVYTTDPDGHFTYVTPSGVALTGYSEEKLLTMHYRDLVSPLMYEKMQSMYREQLRGKDDALVFDFPLRLANGQTRWVEQKVTLFRDEHKGLLGYVGVVREIEERKEAEEKLERFYAAISQPQLSLPAQLAHVLKAGCQIFGFEIGMISHVEGQTFTIRHVESPDYPLEAGQTFELKQTFCDLAYQANGLIVIEDLAASPYAGQVQVNLFELQSYIGTPLTVAEAPYGTLSFSSPQARVRPFTSTEREIFLLMGQWVSATLERQIVLEALTRSESNFRTLFENSPAGIIRLNADFKIELIHFPRFPKESLALAIGLDAMSFIPDEYKASVRGMLTQVFAEGRTVSYETKNIDPVDGLEHWYFTNAAPIIEGGQVVSALLVSEDITERKQAELQIQTQNEALVKANRELALARKQAEEISRLKSAFLATMSHELRTPLNAVIGYSQILLAGMTGPMTDEQHEFQERVLVNAEHLLHLINEMLDLSRIEAGRMELTYKRFNLRQCLEEVVIQNGVLAQAKNLTFNLHVDEGLPESIVGDRARIKQILINLTSNAIKFTDQGEVRLSVVPYPDQRWRIMVSDTGVGIPLHMHGVIFDEFRQAEEGASRGGTGLGLAIVRKLVNMMKGRIQLDSEVGQGSNFIVTLPLMLEPPAIELFEQLEEAE